MKTAVLGYLFDKKNKKILLGKKKHGMAKGLVNGFGGKVESTDKTISDGLSREFFEETTINVKNPKLRSILHFREQENETIRVYVYFMHSWKGKPKETKEMKVFWTPINKIPVNKMWPSDQLWYPIISKFDNTIIDLYFKSQSPLPERIDVKFNQKLSENLYK